MGLIGNVMQPLYLGVSCWLMPPMAFLQKPLRWLKLISEAGVTCTGGPDFAYALCVNKVREAEREGLDLSRWAVAYNGAEPIRSETVARFQAAYAPYGLQPGAMYPCYGLAEATLFVSGDRAGTPLTTLLIDSEALSAGLALASQEGKGVTLVSSGHIWGEVQVVVADPHKLTCFADGQVGEIWLLGNSVTKGYWNAPEANSTLWASLAQEPDKSYLRTGDLGFLHEDQLYVTGRLKEVLIVRGRNHYPQDIEHTVQCACPEFVSGSGVTFMAGDELVAVQEIRRSALRHFDFERALEQTRSAVALQHGLTLAHLVAVKPGTVAKTSSGKLRRRFMCSQWQAGQISAIGTSHRAKSSTIRDSALITLLEAKGLSVRPQHTLSELGIDSLQRLELHAFLEQELSRSIPLELLLDDLTLETIDQQLQTQPVSVLADQSPEVHTEQVLEITPWQQAIWLHQQANPDTAFYNLATLVDLPDGVTSQQVQRSLDTLTIAHPQLSATLNHNEWSIGTGVMLEYEDVSGWTPAQRTAWLMDFRSRPFDLAATAPWRCALLSSDGLGSQMALVAHHLAIDHMAAQTLLADLARVIAGEHCMTGETSLPVMLGASHASAASDQKADASWLASLIMAPEQIKFNLPVPSQPAAMARDRHLPAAMLAIHAAGASYVPMDFSYPAERLAMMMEDSQCRIVMTRECARFPEHQIITPEDLMPEVTGRLAAAQSDSVAYVLYTSGSTGRPKGVQVTHANIAALLDWAQGCLSDQERERVLASTSVCFDLSVFEIFVPLCLGTCCVMVERILDLAVHPVDVSLVNIVPSAVEALLQADAFPERTRVALVAGEPFRQSLVDRLLRCVLNRPGFFGEF